jgi:Ca2+-binding EF-hand superfamily protein
LVRVRHSLIALLSGIFLAGSAHACMSSVEELDAQFAQYDTDHNGKLSEAEFITAETADSEATLQAYPHLGESYRETLSADAHQRYAKIIQGGKAEMTRQNFNPRPRKRCR